MNNNTKKYGMGGAVQSFSSPMLAQGMQGGLSGFGTSGLQTFADGGQMTDIERILAKYKAMESNKPKEDETSEFLRKSWEGKNIDDYVMYSDKYKRGGKMAQGGLIEHGLQEGDNIVKEVDNKWLIVKSKSGVFSVVDIEKGSRFIVGLDDSKMSGKRTSAKAGVKQAMDYINYIKSTKMAKGGTFANGGGLDDAKIYVADLAEYNNGRLVGKWLDLSDYSSGAEVMEAIQEMLDEQTKKDKYGDVHEEYAIHDFEGFPSSFYHESMGESDFDQLYEILKIADDANLPLDVLMKAMSDLGYEDDPQRVAEEYSSSIPASMGNEWRDFAYEWADSVGIDGVGNIESYFDYEEFGNDIRMDYSQEELEEMGYDDLSDEELGERNVEEIGGVENLPKNTLEMYFDYAKLGRDLEYDYTAIRGKDGDFYFFNRNFAKGGKVKNKKEVDIKNTRYRVLVRNNSSNEFREGAYFIEASSKEKAEEIALAKFKKEFGTKRGISVFVHSIKEVPMENGKERTRKYYVKMRNRNGSEKDNFIIDAFEETTALRRAFAMFRKKYNRPSAFDDNQEEFLIVIDDIYPIDEIRENGVTTYKRTFAKGGKVGNFKVGDIVKSTDKKDGYGTIVEIEGNMAVVDFEDRLSNHIKFLSLSDLKKVSSNKFAKGGEVSDELVEYSIPTWAVSSLINADDSGLEDEDIEKINKFVDNVVARHGNAFFMLGEKSEESNFEPYNDIDRLGSDVTILYIRPSEKYAKGGEVKFAEGGIVKHGLKLYDKIVRANFPNGVIIEVENNSDNTRVGAERAEVNLVTGKRYPLTYDKKLGKWVKEYAKGGKIGFQGLANKVAKRYVGKKVSKEYQAEYGKTYDAKEAKEVGNKVAGKVYQQQVAKKKIVRKLQRKSK